MRILFIPFDSWNLKSNEHVPIYIHILKGKNELIGVKRAAAFTYDKPTVIAAMKLFVYTIKVFLFGLRHRKEFDLIFFFDNVYALVGVCIHLFTGKPCVRSCASFTPEWIHRVKPALFLRLGISISEAIAKKFAQMHIVLSEADRRAYVKYGYDPDKVVAISRPADFHLVDNIIDDKAKLRARLNLDRKSKILIYTGRRDYWPNMEAAEWINRELAPEISKRINGAHILMTGGGKKTVPTHPIIAFTGLVPNLFEYIHVSDVFIAPIEMPSGRLTKVMDALSCATPTVVLESATNGIPELVDGDNVMIAKDRNEFIEKTIYLLEHPDEAKEIGLRGRKMLEEHYAWSVWEDKLNHALQTCLPNK